MALLKYLGPFDEVRVSVAGQEVGIVAKGDKLSVPDELAGQSEWQPESWELMSETKPTASASGTNTK
jgi:hypothetical protein